MQHIVIDPRPLVPPFLAGRLPAALLCEIGEKCPLGGGIEEIRLRRERCASLTVAGQSIRLDTCLSGEGMDDLLTALCQGSVYAHSEQICNGFLPLPGGIRVGVCGEAALQDGKVTGVRDVSALVIRIPHDAPPVGGEAVALLAAFSYTRGVLLYAPPGVGKTTVLRGAAKLLAGGDDPRRVAVVDTRGELFGGRGDPDLLLDVLSFYPKGKGIEIATRSLSAQVIVCDEIGDLGEAKEILNAHAAGVPLLASAHGRDLGELLARPGMRLLHEAKCFGAYVGITRQTGRFLYSYDVCLREAADGRL